MQFVSGCLVLGVTHWCLWVQFVSGCLVLGVTHWCLWVQFVSGCLVLGVTHGCFVDCVRVKVKGFGGRGQNQGPHLPDWTTR